MVNIVPVIAKADTLTLEERDFFKKKVASLRLRVLSLSLSFLFLVVSAIKSASIFLERHLFFSPFPQFFPACGDLTRDGMSSCGLLSFAPLPAKIAASSLAFSHSLPSTFQTTSSIQQCVFCMCVFVQMTKLEGRLCSYSLQLTPSPDCSGLKLCLSVV